MCSNIQKLWQPVFDFINTFPPWVNLCFLVFFILLFLERLGAHVRRQIEFEDFYLKKDDKEDKIKMCSNDSNLKWVLLSMNLANYTHVLVRKQGKNGFLYMGGGLASAIIDRFGNETVERSFIEKDNLVIYIK